MAWWTVKFQPTVGMFPWMIRRSTVLSMMGSLMAREHRHPEDVKAWFAASSTQSPLPQGRLEHCGHCGSVPLPNLAGFLGQIFAHLAEILS